MPITRVTSRELNQHIGRAKRAAHSGPVFITNRGRPVHVLLSFEDYQRLVGRSRSIMEALSMPGLADIDFQAAQTQLESHEVDFS